MAIAEPQPSRWYPLPIRRYREIIEMFRYDWNMMAKADFGEDYPEIDFAEAERLWVELNDEQQQAVG
ncbi:hypothetical protein [Streptacidiphilus cavernicola]|uniref:Uncharacterized protein n=1 Tax=Streptacidiphilus cavernicola TaxID=3342716 RepID=A0ABV6VXZ8_9ACTN